MHLETGRHGRHCNSTINNQLHEHQSPPTTPHHLHGILPADVVELGLQRCEVGDTDHPVTGLMQFLKYMMDWVRQVVHAALDKMKGLSFWISGHVRYSHPARETKYMRPQYLHTAKRRLMNDEELEKLDGMVGTILLHNANFVRQSSGLILADVLSFRFKVCQVLPLVVREYKELPTFLAKNKAIVNV